MVLFHLGCLGRHIIRPLRLSIWSPFHPLVHKAVPAPTANVSYYANYAVYNLKPVTQTIIMLCFQGDNLVFLVLTDFGKITSSIILPF